MRVLVTGGAGFIGSHVVDAYLAAGHEVAVVDNLATGSRAHLNERASFYQVDVRDRDALDAVFAEVAPQVVNHHAAEARIGRADADPSLALSVNVDGTLRVLECCRKHGVEKVVFVSTAAVYGLPERVPIDEAHPLCPATAYGVSKASAEHLVRWFCDAFGLRYTIFRYANIYGPRQSAATEAGVISIFLRQLLEGEEPTITWDGEQRRDFTYVGDVVQANLLVLDRGDGETLNIGTGVSISVNEVFATLCRELGQRIAPRYALRRRGDPRDSCFDVRRARDVLGWEPRVSFAEGVRRLIAHARAETVRY